ncbi:hypothetical protein T310_10175, partial [Rasamsonia emersonii CBS 393.64]
LTSCYNRMVFCIDLCTFNHLINCLYHHRWRYCLMTSEMLNLFLLLLQLMHISWCLAWAIKRLIAMCCRSPVVLVSLAGYEALKALFLVIMELGQLLQIRFEYLMVKHVDGL